MPIEDDRNVVPAVSEIVDAHRRGGHLVQDPALGEDRRLAVQGVLGVDDPILLPAKHFLQENQAPALAGAIAALARR